MPTNTSQALMTNPAQNKASTMKKLSVFSFLFLHKIIFIGLQTEKSCLCWQRWFFCLEEWSVKLTYIISAQRYSKKKEREKKNLNGPLHIIFSLNLSKRQQEILWTWLWNIFLWTQPWFQTSWDDVLNVCEIIYTIMWLTSCVSVPTSLNLVAGIKFRINRYLQKNVDEVKTLNTLTQYCFNW